MLNIARTATDKTDYTDNTLPLTTHKRLIILNADQSNDCNKYVPHITIFNFLAVRSSGMPIVQDWTIVATGQKSNSIIVMSSLKIMMFSLKRKSVWLHKRWWFLKVLNTFLILHLSKLHTNAVNKDAIFYWDQILLLWLETCPAVHTRAYFAVLEDITGCLRILFAVLQDIIR